MAKPVDVLVVDDDPSIRQLADRILTERGYRVTTCANSTEAIDRLKEEPYGCVLLDIRMPGMEGTELLPIIKHQYSSLPVILVSAYLNGTDTSYYSSLGAYELVSKPFDSDQLVEVIKRALGQAETIPIMLKSLSLHEARDQVYRKLIVTALRRTNWNQVKAAQLLGVSRYCLIRWLRKLNITY